MKAKNYCIGVENTVANRRKLLFLDIDQPSLPEELLIDLYGKTELSAILILRSGKGFHVVAMKPLTAPVWREYLYYYRDFIDQQFFDFSLKNNYSVLRISPKISCKDGKTVEKSAPTFHSFIELSNYPETSVSLLYKRLYQFQSLKSYIPPEGVGKAILHFYITGGE